MSYMESNVNYSTYDGFSRARHQAASTKSATLSSYSSNNRNKYNTLTPVEAKKLAKFLNVRAPVVRTASVLHKPRPPPMVITNLDEIAPKSQISTTNNSTPLEHQITNTIGGESNTCRRAVNGTRSSSSCSNGSYRDQRHSINFGQNYNTTRDQRSSVYATLTRPTKTNNINSNITSNNPIARNNNTLYSTTSPNDSESNLSFRSSLDIVDSAYGSDRLQTMSVDLGNPAQHYATVNPYQNLKQEQQSLQLGDDHEHQTIKNSDESYVSARSHHSDTNNFKSLSKVSLSSSTSKVFQNQLYNLKKFFRHMPMRRSFISSNSNNNNNNNFDASKPVDRQSQQHQALSESVSQLCLNRSQSPPCFSPPPPVELKSMSYMESSVNYSNYDEFTRVRNQQSSTLLNNNASRLSQHPPVLSNNNPREQIDSTNGVDDESWQLMSLPVSYERNLATVVEEKQNCSDSIKNTKLFNNNNNNHYQEKILIKPPANFEDTKSFPSNKSYETDPKTSSSQSLTSIATADSVLDFQQVPANSYRFSYAQQISFEPASSRRSAGLPPKMPISNETKSTPSCGTSSNSSMMDDSSNCDHQASLGDGRNLTNNKGESTITNADIELDTTVISDSSTLYGDTSNTAYVSKCAELEQQVNCLRNKLLTKDKELTDLQLKQWSADYLIDQLKATISRLEKENSQLKASVGFMNRVNC